MFKASLLLLLLASPGLASVQTLKFSTNTQVTAPRWMYGEKLEKSLFGSSQQLQKIKASFLEGKYQLCLGQIKAGQKKVKSLYPWLLRMKLLCATSRLKNDKLGRQELASIISEVESNSHFLLVGAQTKLLREAFVEGMIVLFENQLKGQRGLAWKTFDRIQKYQNWLGQDQQAKVFKTAGELAFIQQKLMLSYDLYMRSLDLQDQAELRSKFNSIREILIERKLIKTPETPKRSYRSSQISSTEAEIKLFERMKTALSAGDLVPAVQDGVKLLSQFPAGVLADKVEDQILQVYFNVARKDGSKYKPLKKSIIGKIKDAPSDRIYSWAKRLSYRGLYEDSYELALLAQEGYETRQNLHKVLYLAAISALYSGEYKNAIAKFLEVTEKAAGSKESEQAYFRLGLIFFRLGRMSEAAAQFERLLAVNSDSDWTNQSMYWLWRSLQGIDKERAVEAAKSLIERYPLTYYGLRARAESNDNMLVWPKTEFEFVEVEIKLTSFENLAWERLFVLLKAGWFDEAQAELETLPKPQEAADKVVYAKLWSLAFDHHKAADLLQEAWDEDGALLSLSHLKMAYPFEFQEYIKEFSAKEEINETLLLSLIRQESSFAAKAESRSGALGLMQLMPATARDVANRLRIKNLTIPIDLYSPHTNIRMGSSYLGQMLRAFDGHVPLSLAAYNTGIGRMRRWLSLRPDLQKLSLTHTSNYRNEIWIDELPWGETSFYVKAILRNYLLYQLIAKAKVHLPDPIWRR